MSGKELCSKIIEKRWRYARRATVKYTRKTDFVSLRHYGEPCASRGARTVREGASTRRLPHDTNTYGQSKGRSGSYSTNWQLTGRELLMPDEVRMLDNQYALLFIRGERPVRDLKYDILKHPNIKLTTDGGAEPYRHGEDVHSIVSIRFDKELLKQAAEKDGQDAPKHRFILLTEEELEQKFIELEEQENAEQQKGK